MNNKSMYITNDHKQNQPCVDYNLVGKFELTNQELLIIPKSFLAKELWLPV